MGWTYHNKPPMGWPLDYENGLVPNAGFWPFLGGSGNIVQDLSGNENHGQLDTDLTWVSGKFGSALNFPASNVNDIITIPYNPSLAVDYITLVWWINPTLDSSGNIGGLFWDQEGSASSRLFLFDDGSLGAQVSLTTGNNNWATSAGDVIANVWQQVVYTWDGANEIFYVNGVEVGRNADTGILSPSANDRIIGLAQSNTFIYKGKLSSFQLYNHALSASEVALLYRYPSWMFKDPDEIPVLDQYYTVGVGAVGIMTTNTGFWGPTF